MLIFIVKFRQHIQKSPLWRSLKDGMEVFITIFQSRLFSLRKRKEGREYRGENVSFWGMFWRNGPWVNDSSLLNVIANQLPLAILNNELKLFVLRVVLRVLLFLTKFGNQYFLTAFDFTLKRKTFPWTPFFFPHNYSFQISFKAVQDSHFDYIFIMKLL